VKGMRQSSLPATRKPPLRGEPPVRCRSRVLLLGKRLGRGSSSPEGFFLVRRLGGNLAGALGPACESWTTGIGTGSVLGRSPQVEKSRALAIRAEDSRRARELGLGTET